MSAPTERLRHELGTEPPPALRRLAPAEQERLAGALASARRRQRRALEQAIDEGLGIVPRLARAAVKKALF